MEDPIKAKLRAHAKELLEVPSNLTSAASNDEVANGSSRPSMRYLPKAMAYGVAGACMLLLGLYPELTPTGRLPFLVSGVFAVLVCTAYLARMNFEGEQERQLQGDSTEQGLWLRLSRRFKRR